MEERRVTFIGVDRRLRESGVVDTLGEDPQLGLVFLHLDEGQYLLCREAAVVRLPLSRFLDSVKNGGLKQRADELSGHQVNVQVALSIVGERERVRGVVGSVSGRDRCARGHRLQQGVPGIVG